MSRLDAGAGLTPEERAHPHVTHSTAASIYATKLRGETHESLACLAANLMVALERITYRNLEDLRGSANAALIEAIEDAADYLEVAKS